MSDDQALREALEHAQHENKLLRRQLAELNALDPQALQERIKSLETENVELRGRLERADVVRTEWDARVRALKRELDIARAEQERLRAVLENERLSRISLSSRGGEGRGEE
ncbi:MAG: hypothetical protein U0228_10900 [Myxococcaceae bacterium]